MNVTRHSSPDSSMESSVQSHNFAAVTCFERFRTSLPIDSAFVCGICNYPKSSIEELEAHIAWNHLNWTPFRCSYCPVLRPTKFTIELHVVECHPDKEEKRVSRMTRLKVPQK